MYNRTDFFLVLLLIIVHGASNYNVIGPIVGADEYGYLNNALAFTGEKFYGITKYSPGFSILIAPIYYLEKSLDFQYFLVQCTNILLIIVAYFSLTKLVLILFKRLLTLEKSVIFCCLIYPGLLVYSSLALSEIALFATITIIFTLFALLEFEDDRLINWMLLGLSSGFLFWIHDRSIPIIISVLVLSFVIAYKNKKLFNYLVFFCLVGVFYLFKVVILQNFLLNAIGCPNNCEILTVQTESLHDFSLLKILSSTLSNLGNFTRTFTGQSIYLILSSFGFVGVAIIWLSRQVFKEKFNLTAGLILLSFIGTLLMSTVFVQNAGDRLFSYLIYGRYIEIFGPILLLVGILGIQNMKNSKLLNLAIGLVVVIGVFYFATINYEESFNAVVVTSLWTNLFLENHKFLIWILVNGLLTILIILKWNVLRERVILPLLAIIFLFNGFLFKQKWLIVNSEGFHQSFVIDEFVKEDTTLVGQKIYFDVSGEFSVDTFYDIYILYKSGYSFYKNDLTIISIDDWTYKRDASLILSTDFYPDLNLEYFQSFLNQKIYLYSRKLEDQKSNFVDRVYTILLERFPDPAGKDIWTKYLQSGKSNLDLLKVVLTSEEFKLRHPKVDKTFLKSKLDMFTDEEIGINEKNKVLTNIFSEDELNIY